MVHKVTLIPGDGIGPEVVNATVRVLEATGPKFEWETQLAGADAYAKTKQYIPKELYESVERTRLALKGPVTISIIFRALCSVAQENASVTGTN